MFTFVHVYVRRKRFLIVYRKITNPERDMRELASLTANLSLAGARAFERYGVLVHLPAASAEPAEERPAGAPAPPGAADDGEHGQQARQTLSSSHGEAAAAL